MDVYNELTLVLNDYDKDDFTEMVDRALYLTTSDAIRYCIGVDKMYGDGSSHNLSNRDIDAIKESIVKNAEYIFDIDTPYEISIKYNYNLNLETVISESIVGDIRRAINNRKLELVWCSSENAIESYLDSGCCILLYRKDGGGIICYCDSGNKIVV